MLKVGKLFCFSICFSKLVYTGNAVIVLLMFLINIVRLVNEIGLVDADGKDIEVNDPNSIL